MEKTVAIFPTPTTWVKRAGTRRSEYDLMMLTLRLLWLQENGGIHLVVIERGGTRPGQHAMAVYRTGYGVGLWHGLLTGMRYPFRWVMPAVWKKHQGLIHADKRASRLLVQERWPLLGHITAAKEGAAEGLLMADYICSKEGLYGTHQTEREWSVQFPAQRESAAHVS
jgi:hypothetical protein